MAQDEPLEMVFKTNNTRRMYIPFYLLVLVMVVFSIANNSPFEFFGFLALGGVLVLILTEIHRLNHTYEINSFSVIHAKGYLSRRSRRMDLLSICDMEIHQTVFQRILGYGGVHIRLISGSKMTKIRKIKNPSRFASIIESKMRQIKSGVEAPIGNSKEKDEEFIEEYKERIF